MKLSNLINRGYKKNPHVYIGNGSMYCLSCHNYTRHEAYSLGQNHQMACTVCNEVYLSTKNSDFKVVGE